MSGIVLLIYFMLALFINYKRGPNCNINYALITSASILFTILMIVLIINDVGYYFSFWNYLRICGGK